MRNTYSSTGPLRWCVDTGDWFCETVSSCSSRSMIGSWTGEGGSDGSSSVRISCGCEIRVSDGWIEFSDGRGWREGSNSSEWVEVTERLGWVEGSDWREGTERLCWVEGSDSDDWPRDVWFRAWAPSFCWPERISWRQTYTIHELAQNKTIFHLRQEIQCNIHLPVHGDLKTKVRKELRMVLCHDQLLTRRNCSQLILMMWLLVPQRFHWHHHLVPQSQTRSKNMWNSVTPVTFDNPLWRHVIFTQAEHTSPELAHTSWISSCWVVHLDI